MATASVLVPRRNQRHVRVMSALVENRPPTSTPIRTVLIESAVILFGDVTSRQYQRPETVAMIERNTLRNR
jgi:hypothetical protein